jgi:predicted dehydrogenase
MVWGKAKNVFAIGNNVCTRYPSVRDIKALIEFEDGCTGIFEISEFCSHEVFSLNVTGTGAAVIAEIPAKFRVRAPSTPLDALEEAFHSIFHTMKLAKMYLLKEDPYMNSHVRLIKNYVESIEKHSESLVPVDERIESIRLAKAIENSVRTGKVIAI